MSEDDERALKAARAKALLKKRQQKKSVANLPSSPLASPGGSRALSPTRSDPPALARENKIDFGDVLQPANSDTSWVNSLPRVKSPEHPTNELPPSRSTKSPPPNRYPNVTSSQLEAHSPPVDDRQTLLQSQQQTIALLVSEKAALSAELEHLEGLESKVREKDSLLEQERSRSEELNAHLQQLQTDSHAAAGLIQVLQSTEKELAEKCREQEREIYLLNSSIADLRGDAESHQRRVRELEEQIQSDDRVERLESSLKNTQDRADELEFQLSKLKQVHNTLKSEREETRTQLRGATDELSGWKSKHRDLNTRHFETAQKLTSTIEEKNLLVQEKKSLQAQLDTSWKTQSQLQEQLNLAAVELSSHSRQLQQAHAELRHANRRVEEAELTQKDLQTEGTTLMRSLDEMRPKIVELTGAKLELSEKVSSLEHAIRSRDGVIAQLESTVDELQVRYEESDQQRRQLITRLEAERSSTQTNSVELQTAYAELQAELDQSRARTQARDMDRLRQSQELSHYIEEVDRLAASSRGQSDEISNLRRQLDERKRAEEESQEFLERAQSEIENLRLELTTKEEEVERLRDFAINSAPPSGEARSLDDEMLSSLQQQFALELSAAQSKNRELDSAVFAAQARVHALQKQVNVLEEQLAQAPSGPPGRRSFSPGIPSRPSSRSLHHSDLRRASLSSRRPNNLVPPPLVRTVFDVGLSPYTRHKRQISLGMLKARIDSELAAASSAGSRPPSRVLSPVTSLSTIVEPAPREVWSHRRRPQFLDESHVFWCHSCHGDLVVL